MKRRCPAEHERRRVSTLVSSGSAELPLWRPAAETAAVDASPDAHRPRAQRLGNWAQVLVLALVMVLMVAVLPDAQVRSAASAPATHSAPKATAQVHTARAGTISKSTQGGAVPHVAAPAAAAVPAAAAPAPLRVAIRRGDTLWGFARSYGTTVAALQSLNGMGASTVIYAGSTLRRPCSRIQR